MPQRSNNSTAQTIDSNAKFFHQVGLLGIAINHLIETLMPLPTGFDKGNIDGKMNQLILLNR